MTDTNTNTNTMEDVARRLRSARSPADARERLQGQPVDILEDGHGDSAEQRGGPRPYVCLSAAGWSLHPAGDEDGSDAYETGPWQGARLLGYDAIEYAEARGLLVNKYADPTEGARSGIDPDDARDIAAEDEGLIWLGLAVAAPRTADAPCPPLYWQVTGRSLSSEELEVIETAADRAQVERLGLDDIEAAARDALDAAGYSSAAETLVAVYPPALDVRDPRWYALSARGRETRYGYGNLAQAEEWAARLDGDREYDLYAVEPAEMTEAYALDSGLRDGVDLDVELGPYERPAV